MERNLLNLRVALQGIMANKIRAGLTALGIIFGVAAVIAMLAVGNGAQQEILEQIRLVGVNNIVVAPVVGQEEKKVEKGGPAGQEDKKKFSPGLTLLDVASIRQMVPGVKQVSPEILIETTVVQNGLQRTAKVVGVEPAYFAIQNFELQAGKMFNAQHLRQGEAVCLIGQGIQAKFFPKTDPLGKLLKCGPHWLKVVGVLAERPVSSKSLAQLGIRDYNLDVYVPLQTALIRYTNRALVTARSIQQANALWSDDEEGKKKPNPNYHQVDRVVVQVHEPAQLAAVADVVSRMLKRRHYDLVDYEITIPELLLKQQQRTKDIFNIVLGAIAGISLLVGGIGIMNIMLASVLERIKEIGLRIALGAKRRDIVSQFLFESALISLAGGLVGVGLGVALATLVSGIADIPTIVSPGSVVLSFGVALAVGLVFGIAPARRAAQQDPIASLRYE
ncbi:MAG: ABC transporter permease [Bernardetiaceae bacterium]|jgi:putative ABC transport system permease protein|nr:ABC transporter permease [Bernardetiaceae bacterium]